jgi:hypothetical protein
MLVTFDLPDDALRRVYAAMPSHTHIRPLRALGRALQHLPTANGFLLGADVAATAAGRGVLAEARRRHPWLPLIVVGAPGARLVGRGVVDEWRDARLDREPSLPLARAVCTLPLRRLATMVSQVSHLEPEVRALMVRALAAAERPASVDALAVLAGRHRNSLWKIWRRGERPMPSAGTFIDWLTLLHVVVRKGPAHSWRAACFDVDVVPTSTARAARRLLGAPLSDFDVRVRAQIFRAFLARMLRLERFEIQRLVSSMPDPWPLDGDADAFGGGTRGDGVVAVGAGVIRAGGVPPSGAGASPPIARAKAPHTCANTDARDASPRDADVTPTPA